MENIEKLSKEEKEKFWSEQFEMWRKSGIPQKQYCEEKNLSYWSFRTRYYKKGKKKSKDGFVRIDKAIAKEVIPSKIVLTLNGKVKIEFDENITEEVLRKIFKASEALND